ncbi:MAG: hypothetical protein GDA45_07395 [Chromatiales bacterium]|nr:hypothetical protein [Chromatiales bacterium]
MDKIEKLELLQELEKRQKLKEYSQDFPKFAKEQIQIITKDATQGFVPFELNDAQIYITEKLEEQRRKTGKVRAIILKARQQGISTYCAGRVFWKTYFLSHTRSVVMAHDSATSDALFNMSKNLIKNMAGELKPDEEKSNAKEIVIRSPAYKDNEAKGSYRLYTAGSPEAGRGTTPTIAHLSEVAFWQHDEKILAGLFQGISQAADTEVILESTANGAQGEFYRLWKGAVAGENEYIPIFLPWFWTKEYTRTPPDGMELSVEEEKLQEKYDLTLGQLYWRRLKIAEGGELKFKQEYPASADEAFIVSGANVFNVEKLDKLIPQAPVKQAAYDVNSKTFDPMREGKLVHWEYPDWDTNYIIAADVALGVGQDYSCAIVLDNQYRVVAMYRDNRVDPSLFGELLFYLGRYYNNAFMCVESNSMGIATLQKLESMQYVNLYKQTKIANVSNEEGERLGFRTTSATKPAIIGNLKNLVENEEVMIPSAVIIQEMKDYVSTDTGKTEAAPGCHDDTVMALAMGCEVLRTHWDRLQNTNVGWKHKMAQWKPDDTQWF